MNNPATPAKRNSSPLRQLGLVAICIVSIGVSVVGVWWITTRSTSDSSPVYESPEQAFASALEALAGNKLKEAQVAIRYLESRGKFQQHIQLLRGGVLLRNGSPELALQHLAQVSPEGELQESAIRFAGEALYQTGQFKAAQRCFFELKDLRPKDVDATRWLAAIAYDCGRMDQAIDLLRQLATQVPDDASPHRLMGLIHKDFEQYPLAIENYRAALDRNPSSEVQTVIAIELAECLIVEREYAAARSVLARAKRSPKTVAMQSQCLWSLGQQVEAIDILDGLQETNQPDVLFWRAHILAEQGQYADAVPLLKRGLSKQPHDTTARYQLALAYRALGETQQSQLEIETLEHSKQLLDQLTQLSEQAMKEPENPTIREQMAAVCDELDRPEMAHVWRKAARSMK